MGSRGPGKREARAFGQLICFLGKRKEPMPIVSITRLRVRSWLYLPAFLIQAFRSARQAAVAEGNLATKLLRDRRNTFWTGTSWSTEDSMKAFMRSGVHGPVMRRLLQWCDEAALVHWTQDDVELPSWEQAHIRLLKEGRRSKVNRPSAAHTEFEIPTPVTRRTGELWFK